MISKKLGLSEEDINLAALIGIIARLRYYE